MEWTGRQQLWFLLQSVGLGVLLGVSFDLFSGVCRAIRRRRLVLLLDASFGVFASLITFFGALVMMDGQLHPILFAGALLGFITEHNSIGPIFGWFACRFCRWIIRIGGTFCRLEESIVEKMARSLAHLRFWLQNIAVCNKKSQKNRINFKKTLENYVNIK